MVRLDAAQLYRACRTGDEEAWRLLYSWCLKLARRRLPEQAEDLAQQVCLKLLDGAMERLRDPEALLGYARKTLDNLVKSHWRKAASIRAREREDDRLIPQASSSRPGPADWGPTPEDQAAARDLLVRLGDAIARLPGFCRQTMAQYLRYRLGLVPDYRRMAAVLDIPLGTLSARIKRCLEALRRMPEFRDLGRERKKRP